MRKIDHIGIYGPVNGMGERDLRGDYLLVSLTFDDDEVVRGRYTPAQVEELRDRCTAALKPEGDLGRAVKAARKETTGMEEPPTPKRGFA